MGFKSSNLLGGSVMRGNLALWTIFIPSILGMYVLRQVYNRTWNHHIKMDSIPLYSAYSLRSDIYSIIHFLIIALGIISSI